MKKILLSIIVFATVVLSYGQSQRLVLAEEFTNASCGPCASQNPAFDALLQNNEDIVTSIKYHTSWPGTDPMYSHNPSQANSRVDYYNVSGVPYALIDAEPQTGSSYTGAPANVNQSVLNNAAAVPSPFNVQFQHEISNDEENIFLTMMIEATDDVSGDLVAQMVVIEKHIHFPYPPGSNGEKDFYNVMKYMVPGTSGTDLPDFADGDYLILEGSWELANIYDMDELGAVGFIQNHTSKEVFQAANSSTDPMTPLYDNDAQITEVQNVGEANCSGVVNPHIMLRNNGAATLSSSTIKYYVNEGEVQTYDWTGSLDFLDKAMVELPELSFDVADENTLTVITEMPNGVGDEYVKNDTLRFEFQKAIVTSDYVSLTMRLDANPEETSWEIVNSSNEVIYSGGDYTTPNQFINENYEFETEDCYTFYVYDSGGDGFGTGGFINVHVGDDVILQETAFGSEAYNYFEYATGVGVQENLDPMNFVMFPNPAKESLNVSLFLEKNQQVIFQVMDISGRMIKEIETQDAAQGTLNQQIDLSELENGIYVLRTLAGNQEKINKFSVSK